MNKEEISSNKCPACGRPTHKESKYHAKNSYYIKSISYITTKKFLIK